MNKKSIIQFFKYGIFGFLAGTLNTLLYALFSRCCHFSTILSTIIAWFLANIFSYYMNQLIVFKSERKKSKKALLDLILFLLTRLISGCGDVASMYVFADLLELNDIIVKIISCTVFGVINYFIGKLVIFAKKKPENNLNKIDKKYSENTSDANLENKIEAIND